MAQRKKPKIGRPPKPLGERKAAALTLRLTEAERAAAESAAALANMSVSDWVRKVVAQAAKSHSISDHKAAPADPTTMGSAGHSDA